MKRILLLVFLFFISNNFLFSQDENNCKKVVDLVVKSINNSNADYMYKYLHSDFTISGYKGEIAIKVLYSLCEQLNDKVEKYEFVELTNNSSLKIVYSFHFSKIGLRKATFIFDTNEKLLEMKLFEMKASLFSTKDIVVKQPISDYIKIPFKLVGNLITVDVFLDTAYRTFIFDSGSPLLILNSFYFPDSTNSTKQENKQISKSNSTIKGVSGNVNSEKSIVTFDSLDFYGISVPSKKAIGLNLSHIESELNTEIFGLIGYNFFSNYDILFDYQNSYIVLIKPESVNDYVNSNFKFTTSSFIPFKMNQHIPILETKIGRKTYYLGLDCGAESSLISDKYYKKIHRSVVSECSDSLIGADNNPKIVKKVTLNKIKFDSQYFYNQSFVVASFDLGYDGLLGYSILSKGLTLLSYKNKKIVFFDKAIKNN